MKIPNLEAGLSQADGHSTYNVTSWRFRVVFFLPPPLCLEPDTISLEEAAFMAILYRWQQ
jgi:hypothetical protein